MFALTWHESCLLASEAALEVSQRKEVRDGCVNCCQTAAKTPKEESLTGSGYALVPGLYLFEAMWYCYESSCIKTAFSTFANPLMQWSMIIDFLMINQSFVSGINPTWSWPILFAKFCLLTFCLRFFTYGHKWNQTGNFPGSYCLLKFCY